MHTTRTTAATLAVAALLFTGCTSSSDDKPEPTKTETVTAAPEPETAPLTEEETIEQCTDAVAEAATGWDNWTMPLEDWEDDPDTPDVCKSLEAIDYRVAFLAGLEDAAACGTPDEMPGRC